MSVKKFLPILLILFLFTACKNRVQKSYEFINEYNNAAPLLKSNLIYRSEAKIIGERILEEIIIEIDYDLNLKKIDCETNIAAKMLPKNICFALIQDQAGELINEGAIINLTFRSLDNYILDKIKLDKNLMTQLLSQNQTHVTYEYNFGSNKNSDLIKKLSYLNENLPVENNEFNIKLLNLKLDKYNNVICITEVSVDFAKSLKNPETKSYLKEILLKNEKDQILMQLKEMQGISKIIYRCQNSKGELIDDIIFN